MHHTTDRITYTTAFVTPVVEHWLERQIAQWVHPLKDRSDDPSHHERTLLPRSYISFPIKKRRDVFNFLRSKRFSIYFLQDTHFTLEKDILIRSEWGYEWFFSSKSSNSRGVAVLLNNNFDFKLHHIFRNNGGNLIIMDMTICNKLYV